MSYSCSFFLAIPADTVFCFFYDLEKWFRLNPQWEIKSFGPYVFASGATFPVAVKYDRTDMQVQYHARITEVRSGETLSLELEGVQPRKFSVRLQREHAGTRLSYIEESEEELTDEEKIEVDLWLRSVVNYLMVTSRNTRRSRFWKLFVDRIWLKMSPFGRRITVFVVLGEAFSFALFILFLVWHFYLR